MRLINRKSRKDEYPVRRVAVNTFYMGETEVTQELWKAVMGQNISANQNPKAPVEMVSWNDCQLFIEKLNQLTGMAFRLPTEAEWEFAARGGAFSGHWLFAGDDFLDGFRRREAEHAQAHHQCQYQCQNLFHVV